MEIELRSYRIRPGHFDEWMTGWQTHIRPLREQAGFQVVAAGADADHDLFFWVLVDGGSGGFDEAEARYHATPERLAVAPEPSELIEHAEKIRVVSVL